MIGDPGSWILAFARMTNDMIFFVAVIVRLLFIAVSYGLTNYDIDSWYLVGKTTALGYPIYPDISLGHHPYFPVMLFVYAAVYRIAYNPAAFAALIKILFVVFDLGILFFVRRVAGARGGWLYACNPVTILTLCVQGQFDSIPLFFLIVTLYSG